MLTALTIWDEDVITVEHVLLVITCLGAVMAVCRYEVYSSDFTIRYVANDIHKVVFSFCPLRALIPDEHLVWCPEKLLTAILAHVHYFPDHWKGQAHTTRVRDQFALLFQYKVVSLFASFILLLIITVTEKDSCALGVFSGGIGVTGRYPLHIIVLPKTKSPRDCGLLPQFYR